jgi:phenylacetate-CoA ligase
MPFIRYDLGDLAVYEDGHGADGVGKRRISQILGRHGDYVLLPNGTACPDQEFAYYIRQSEEIWQFRVVQRTPAHFQVLVVADTAYLEQVRGEMLDRLQKNFPPSVSFEIVQVERLDPDPSGKLRSLVSEVDGVPNAWS